MSATGTPDCEQNCERMRKPRPFYKEYKIIKGYDHFHAQVYNLVSRKGLDESPFYAAYKCGKGQVDIGEITQDSQIFVITMNNLFMLGGEDSERWEVRWQVCHKDIDKTDTNQDSTTS